MLARGHAGCGPYAAHSRPLRPVAAFRAVVDRGAPGVAEASMAALTAELTSLSDREAVIFVGADKREHGGLDPEREYERDGLQFRTLPRPPGEELAVVATVNDVHFGETECGVLDGLDVGPVLRSAPGEPPYPEMMNRAAVAEIAALQPDAVVAKGDLTTHGTRQEYQAFLELYGPAFGSRLHHVRGNHDAYHGEDFASQPMAEVELPGVRLAILDTTLPGKSGGRVTADQLEWLDELAARSEGDRPVLLFGHHHVWNPSARSRPEDYFGVNPDDSEKLVALVARRPAIVGYFAGHTHRNRVRHFPSTGDFPWVEVACLKDFPGTWAEYRVHEGGILQIHRRISSPEALSWSERARAMFGGFYPAYAFGRLEDRNFAVWPRR